MFKIWIREYEKYANQTGSFLLDDHYSWVQGVYEWYCEVGAALEIQSIINIGF